MSLARMRQLFELRARRVAGDERARTSKAPLIELQRRAALEKAGGFGLQTGMFMPTIDLMGTDAQQRRGSRSRARARRRATYAADPPTRRASLSALETWRPTTRARARVLEDGDGDGDEVVAKRARQDDDAGGGDGLTPRATRPARV